MDASTIPGSVGKDADFGPPRAPFYAGGGKGTTSKVVQFHFAHPVQKFPGKFPASLWIRTLTDPAIKDWVTILRHPECGL